MHHTHSAHAIIVRPNIINTSSGPAGLRRPLLGCVGACATGATGAVNVGGTLAVAKAAGHWPAVGRHDTEAVEAEGAEAEAIAIPVTKPCWPPRYMRRSPASAEYKDSIALETAMQEAPAVRTKDFHIEADHIAVDRTEPDHTGAAATDLEEHSAHKSAY